ncbi:type II toxin-antitoxin system HicA family toxin [Patescibacteria group bacterium]|nr:type II toxin-antitoxin system HicA family toxin [Patescibacteria group bacterium]MBU4481141.1 type II toxin-antitoxin system HicA family toxin [Patescibacteria group bacterium]
MPKLPVLRSKELIQVLIKLGFYKHHQVGSHAQFKHSDGRRVTVPIHSGKDIGRKTLKGIIDDINITIEEFIKFPRD